MRRLLPASLLLAPALLSAADYLRDIKPLLQERCYACHGALKQKAGLRMDTVGLMRQGGDSGDLLAQNGGLLLARVTTHDLDERMPPEGEGAALTAEQINLLKSWLAAGAPGPADEQPEPDPNSHWAYQLPKDHGRSVDSLLDQKLVARGLKAQAPAAPETWLRRVYLDLTGLPPTPEDIQAFLATQKPSASSAGSYAAATSRAQIVDRLLASPQYGERWGRHFMDVWRYSDWYGLGNQLRYSQKHLWHWRDWIVESLNTDKGYDTMILQMLAADELAPDDRANLRATGFLARSYYLFNRTTWLDDTVEHTSRAFLGLTMQCVKCHDHKYDPVDHSEFYRMRAIFEPMHVRLDPQPGVTDFEKDGLPRVFDLHLDRPTWRHVRGDDKNEDKSRPIEPGVPKALKGPTFVVQPVKLPPASVRPLLLPFVLEDHLRAAEAEIQAAQQQLAKLEATAPGATAAKPERTTAAQPAFNPLSEDFHAEPPGRYSILAGDWRWSDGRLRQFETGASRRLLELRQPHPRDFAASLRFTITGGQKWKSVGLAFDGAGDDDTLVYASAVEGGSKVQVALSRDGHSSYPAGAAKALPIQTGQPYELELRVRGDLLNVRLDGKLVIAHRLSQRIEGGRLRLVTFDAAAEFHALSVAELAADAPLEPDDSSSPLVETQQLPLARLRLALAQTQPDWLRAVYAAESQPSDKTLAAKAATADARRRLAQAELDLFPAQHSADLQDSKKKTAAEKKLKEAQSALAKARKQAREPGQTYTRPRASLKAQEGPDEAGNAEVQGYPETSSGRRLALARWIADEANPLTARVLVNHVWLRHFGTPLVADVSDFGRRSPAPLHQEVLDSLAVRFMQNGWSLKWLHRELVLSTAYARLSSNAGADPQTLASDPDNLHYWRMNARRLESQAVRDSLLQVSGRLDPSLGGPTLDPVKLETTARRSLYFNQTANEQNLFLGVFDNANVLECYRREESVAPQQALALVNSRLSHDCATALARRLAPLDDRSFVRESFLAVLGRSASAEEDQTCLTSLTELSRPLMLQALFNHNDFVTVR